VADQRAQHQIDKDDERRRRSRGIERDPRDVPFVDEDRDQAGQLDGRGGRSSQHPALCFEADQYKERAPGSSCTEP
jgi:hypothetical protein